MESSAISRLTIDSHHHVLPPMIVNLMTARSVVARGLTLPPWSLELSLDFMDRNKIAVSILSMPVPLILLGKKGPESVSICREVNTYMAEIRDKQPSRFGFFATLPSLEDTELCLEQLRFALDELGADGVTIFTSYGDKYIGHPTFEPIWRELSSRAAVVFIHPTMEGMDKAIHEPRVLPRPLVDWTHETTRAAVHLITTNTVQKYPSCKIILSHGGGTLPYVAGRVADLAEQMHVMHEAEGDFLQATKSFYFDTALCGDSGPLQLLLDFAAPGRVLYGTDYPFAHGEKAEEQRNLIEQLTTTTLTNSPSGSASMLNEAAQELFPRFWCI